MTAQQFSRLTDARTRHRDIVRDLIERLPRSAENSGLKDWTSAMKSTMHDLCRQYLGSCGNEFWGTHHLCGTGGHREWLLDVAWYVQDDYEEGVLLGLESEWADDLKEVRFDFSKLLSIKAPIKLLLFEAGKNSKRTSAEQINDLNELCRIWPQHSLGDLLYAINFHDGEHETHFYEVRRAGAIPDFEFRRLAELSGKDSSRTKEGTM